MGSLGVQEMIVIFLVALVLFGPKKLPELGKTLGKAITEFRRASNDLKATFEREMHTLEREAESLKQVADTTANSIYKHATLDQNSFEQYSGEDHSSYTAPQIEDHAAHNPTTVSEPEVPVAESHEAAPSALWPTPQDSTPEVTPVEERPVEVAHVEGTVPRESGTHQS
jgi:sec-independent protein translocase protein TatA